MKPMSPMKTVNSHGTVLFLARLFLAFVFLSVVTGCDPRDDPPDGPQHNGSPTSKQFDAFSERLGALENSIQQQQRDLKEQSRLLQAIPDRVAPFTESPEWEGRLRQLGDQAGKVEHFSDQLRTIEKRIEQQQRILRGQSGALQGLVGSLALPSAPPEWETRLAELEAQVRDHDQWPRTEAEARIFFDRVSALIADLPPRAEPRYLHRLSPIRWTAMAFGALYPPPNEALSPADLEGRAADLRALANVRPTGGAEPLVEALRKRATELSDEAVAQRIAADRQRITKAVEQANGYLTGAAGSATDVAATYEFLDRYVEAEPTPAADDDVPALLQNLYKELLRRRSVERAAALRKRWENALNFKRDQPDLYEAAARTLLQQVVAAGLALALENVKPSVASDGDGLVALEAELRGAIGEIETTAVQRADKLRALAKRQYQRWALGEIKKFKDAPGSETAKAMVRHLLPIDLALLEHPVHEHYQAAFQNGWRSMDGEPDQTQVAEMTVTTKKKTLQEFLEKVEEMEKVEKLEEMEEVEEGS